VYWSGRRRHADFISPHAARNSLGETFCGRVRAALELQAMLNIFNISFYANRFARPSNALSFAGLF
jgi:hypothetical protein